MSAVIGRAGAHTPLRLYCSPSILAVIKVVLISPSRESAVQPQEKQLKVRGKVRYALTEAPLIGQVRKQLAAQNWHWLGAMEQTQRTLLCLQKERYGEDKSG